MDNVQSIGSVSGIISFISIILYGVYRCCQHFHCGSKCCGAETSLDVDLGEGKTQDESVYLRLKNLIPRPHSLQGSTSSVGGQKKSLVSPPPVPPSSPVLRVSSLQEAERLASLEQHVRF